MTVEELLQELVKLCQEGKKGHKIIYMNDVWGTEHLQEVRVDDSDKEVALMFN